MYAFPRVRTERLPDFDDERFAYELLEHKHVLVAPGVSFNVPVQRPLPHHDAAGAGGDPRGLRRIEDLLHAWSVAEA
jgi:alanine-synthesizing transaminase